jgi:3-oxoacyl-(acyl-carrier-protein) synthase
MIYLTHAQAAFTDNTELLEGLYPQRVHWFPDTYARVKTGMSYPPHKLVEKVLNPELCEWLRGTPMKTAFILAGGNQHFAGINKMAKSPLVYEYKFLPLTLTQVYAGRIAQQLGANDLIQTDATACVSSLKACMDVQTLIRHYEFDRVIVLGVEDAVSASVLDFFGESGASLTAAKEAETGVVPSAFDEKNQGFHVGQGAVLGVFHSHRAVNTLKMKPLATLHGAYTASEDCSNAIGQRQDGLGYVKAMTGAMAQAGMLAKDIKVVKTHGTGTASNNAAERAALESVLEGFIATSFKPKIGHTMGASGLLESVMLCESISRGVIPAIPNRTQNDSVFLSQDTVAPSGLFLSLAAGMGNVYSAALFEVI